MKICFISDTHGKHNEVIIPQCDILIHSGDTTSRGVTSELLAFLEWFKLQPAKYKIFISGNHDFIFEKNPYLAKSILKNYSNIFYLEDDMAEIDGIKIYGTPWQPEFFNWAFNLPRGKKLEKKWEIIPSNIDILVTHGPPMHILDLTDRGVHTGCENLYEHVINRIKPKIHCFGHIHEQYGILKKNNIKFINASLLDIKYRCVNKPILIEL